MSDRMTFGQGIIDLLKRSILVQSTVTLAFVITACLLWMRGEVPPDGLMNMLMIVIAFWMGSKTQHALERAAK